MTNHHVFRPCYRNWDKVSTHSQQPKLLLAELQYHTHTLVLDALYLDNANKSGRHIVHRQSSPARWPVKEGGMLHTLDCCSRRDLESKVLEVEAGIGYERQGRGNVVLELLDHSTGKEYVPLMLFRTDLFLVNSRANSRTLLFFTLNTVMAVPVGTGKLFTHI